LIALGLAFSAPVIAQQAPAAPTAAATNATAPATPAVAAPAELKPVADIGQPIPAGYELQPQVTKNGQFALWMHNAILMPIIVAISVFVLGLLFWVAFRYRKAANPVPSKTSHNTLIEVIWTLVPVLILVGIAIPSIGLLAAQYKPVGKNAVTIKATGNQWFWSYTYPDHGDFEIVSNMLTDEQAKAKGEPRLLGVDNRIVVPVGVPIRVLTTSNDVIHAFAVPALWTKMDAVPGRINETSFTIEKPGVYYGQCSELCGARHGFMPIAVEAVSPAQFAQWIASKGGKMPGAKPASTHEIGAAAPNTPVDALPAAPAPALAPALAPAPAPAAPAPVTPAPVAATKG
jgi:cytochrome c oxidase subunit 2